MSGITLRIIKNTEFSSLYSKIIKNEFISNEDIIKLLQLAIIFLNSDNQYVFQLGYRIIVMFSIQYSVYEPLYEVAINLGLYPISHFIESKKIERNKKNIFTEINASYMNLFNFDNIYMSANQFDLKNFYKKNNENSLSVVAPTSYGKTELILQTIKMNIDKNICIITPTKSLLAQTKKRILNESIIGVEKIIIHPEMYRIEDTPSVFVLTQERVLRILKSDPRLYFDIVIVDEAHNLLLNDERSQLLACVIAIIYKRHSNTIYKFLTPFIEDNSNLLIRNTNYSLKNFRVDEYLKTERIYAYDILGGTGFNAYDQFLNKWYKIENEVNNLTQEKFLLKYMGDKNIVYFNKPVDIEKFSNLLISVLPDIKMNPQLEKAIADISSFLNPDYTLIKCIKKGFIYHHGSVPDSIRQYIEYQYINEKEIKLVLTTSTLLEGVNLPADKMFIFDNKKGRKNLSASSFRNLIGRVCRFGEIFSEGNNSLNKLMPEIYLVIGNYFNVNNNYKTFVENVMRIDKEVIDNPENVLLNNSKIGEGNEIFLRNAEEFMENYETGIINNYEGRIVKTNVGRSLIHNNILEFDIFSCEENIQDKISYFIKQNYKIDNSSELMQTIDVLFLSNVDYDKNKNFMRFTNESAQAYYSYFLNQRINNESYSKMILRTLGYWMKIIRDNKDPLVYVGKWGDCVRNNGIKKLWVDVRKKSRSDLINLAIVKIKEELDFLDNSLVKYIEVLYEVNLIEESFYYRLKYGTDDEFKIALIKNGLSIATASLLIEKYFNFIFIDVLFNIVKRKQGLINEMRRNNENDIYILEVKESMSYE